jgi:DNA invertase Pin-like site-specific DNA recombinase
MHALQTGPVAIYARSATATDQGQSIARQLRDGRTFIARHGGNPDEVQEFTDLAASGADLDRAGLTAMLQAAEAARIRVIVTADMSRISRDSAHLVQIRHRLQSINVLLLDLGFEISISPMNVENASGHKDTESCTR